MSYLNAYADEAEALSEDNYIVRHWRGYLPLPTSYWINGGLLFAATAMVGEIIVRAISDFSSLQAVAGATIAFIALLLSMRVWSLVGIWRSAGRHRARGGSGFWAFAARVMVVLGAISSVGQAGNLALQLREFGGLAIGGDPIGSPASFTLSPDGRDLTVAGFLTSGTAAQFEAAARQAPKLERVVLSSGGGRVFEAERIAKIVRRRALSTHVADECHSACTMLLLAGTERTAADEAQIGFHRVTFPGLSPQEDEESNRSMSLAYAAAGLPAPFIQRVAATSSDSMWIPTLPELIQARVLTDASGQLSKMLAQAAKAESANLPARMDDITTLLSVKARDDTIVYRYRVAAEAALIDHERLSREARLALQPELCQGPARGAIDLGGTFIFEYGDIRGNELAAVVIRECLGQRLPRPARS